ncbi:unnamed protein product [Closterium sp. NIES-54]
MHPARHRASCVFLLSLLGLGLLCTDAVQTKTSPDDGAFSPLSEPNTSPTYLQLPRPSLPLAFLTPAFPLLPRSPRAFRSQGGVGEPSRAEQLERRRRVQGKVGGVDLRGAGQRRETRGIREQDVSVGAKRERMGIRRRAVSYCNGASVMLARAQQEGSTTHQCHLWSSDGGHEPRRHPRAASGRGALRVHRRSARAGGTVSRATPSATHHDATPPLRHATMFQCNALLALALCCTAALLLPPSLPLPPPVANLPASVPVPVFSELSETAIGGNLPSQLGQLTALTSLCGPVGQPASGQHPLAALAHEPHGPVRAACSQPRYRARAPFLKHARLLFRDMNMLACVPAGSFASHTRRCILYPV